MYEIGEVRNRERGGERSKLREGGVRLEDEIDKKKPVYQERIKAKTKEIATTKVYQMAWPSLNDSR